MSFNVAAFLTRGTGYYEEYRAAQNFARLWFTGLSMMVRQYISETDLIRQLWLDNNFYGTIFSVQHKNTKTQFTLGGGWNKYDGKHYGIVTWATTGISKRLSVL